MLIETERFRLKQPVPARNTSRRPRRRKPGRRFIKGPIPWNWLRRACTLPGKAPIVGLALWYWHGLAQSKRLAVSHADLRELRVGPGAVARALRNLEQVGLVSVNRHRGRNPIVTLCGTSMN
ncbi:MAG: hypothetical protein V3T70_09890 [Phycisphaerae bacterium]